MSRKLYMIAAGMIAIWIVLILTLGEDHVLPAVIAVAAVLCFGIGLFYRFKEKKQERLAQEREQETHSSS